MGRLIFAALFAVVVACSTALATGPGSLARAVQQELRRAGLTNEAVTLTSSGVVRTGDGSVSAPSLSFASDTNTGVFRLTANQLAVGADGLTTKVFGGAVALTDNVATTVCTLGLTTGGKVAVKLHYAIDVSNGTDHQVTTGAIHFAAVDKAGTLTASTVVESSDQITAVSSGTLNDTWSRVDGTDQIAIRVQADSSLTPTSMTCRFELTLLSGAATVTIP
jgi:hypothetical protein